MDASNLPINVSKEEKQKKEIILLNPEQNLLLF